MVKSKLRNKYKGLSNGGLLNKAYELGFNYEEKSTSCSQSTVAAIHELVEMDDVWSELLVRPVGVKREMCLALVAQ
jgi:hypothetical protein